MHDVTLPDYTHSSVNLMASLSLALGGGESGYGPLTELGQDELQGRPVILLVIDGLGSALLRRHPDTFLARHTLSALRAVFPSTTAAAVTSFSTGVAPQQHAITGWHMWLREIGTVATILPFVPRHGGASFSQSGYSPRDFIGAPPLFDRLKVPVELLSPAWIVNSDYNRASGGNATRHGVKSFDHLVQQLLTLTSDGAPRYLYAYWAELDALAHQFGIASDEVTNHLHDIDAALAAVAAQLRAQGALLLVTADHGLIDTDEPHTLYLHNYPAIADTLALPLCGEPRTAYAYLRHGKERSFRAAIASELGHACRAVESAELIAQGYFGLGQPHRELAARVGDYTLLMEGGFVIRHQLPHEKPFRQIGVHGGLSRNEMEIPLIRCG